MHSMALSTKEEKEENDALVLTRTSMNIDMQYQDDDDRSECDNVITEDCCQEECSPRFLSLFDKHEAEGGGGDNSKSATIHNNIMRKKGRDAFVPIHCNDNEKKSRTNGDAGLYKEEEEETGGIVTAVESCLTLTCRQEGDDEDGDEDDERLGHGWNPNTQHNNGDNDNDDDKSGVIPALVSALLASLTTGGTTYAFGIYSSALKHSLHLSQSQLDTISSSFFCAGLLSFIPGGFSDIFGPKCSLITGGVCGAVSLLTYWVVARQFVAMKEGTIVPTLSFLGVLTFLCCAMVTGSVFKIIVSTCGSGSKGKVVGAAKGYVGLGAGAYACIFEAFRGIGSSSSGGESGGSADSGSGGGKHEEGEEGGDVSDLNFLPMAAFFFIMAATLPPICLLRHGLPRKTGRARTETLVEEEEEQPHCLAGEEQNDGIPPWRKRRVGYVHNGGDDGEDETTPLHFRVLYGGLLALGAVVVGSSILELYNDNSESSSSSTADNGRGNDNGGDDRNSNNGSTTPSRHGANYWMAFVITALWIGPILSLLCLPTKRKTSISSSLDDEIDKHLLSQQNQELQEEGLFSSSRTNETELPSDYSIGGDVVTTAKEALTKEREKHNDDNDMEATNEEYDNTNARDDMERLLPLSFSSASSSQNTPIRTPETNTSPTFVYQPIIVTPPQDRNLIQMLQTLPAWLLLWTCTILAGGGTVMTNNVGQMVEALHLHPSTAPASLALFSAAQAASRVGTGALSEIFMNCTPSSSATTSTSTSTISRWRPSRIISCCAGYSIPRPAFFIVASLSGFLSHLLLALATSEIAFVVGVMLSGAAFGMIWPLMVLIVGECFGTENVGANYMFYDGVTSAVGTLLLSKFVAQEVYESHIVNGHHHDGGGGGDDGHGGQEDGGDNDSSNAAAADNNDDDDGLTCYGRGCFQMSHFIVSGLSLSCVITSVAMLYTTRHVYRKQR